MIKQHGRPSFHFIIISPLKVFFFTFIIKRSTFIKNFGNFYLFYYSIWSMFLFDNWTVGVRNDGEKNGD